MSNIRTINETLQETELNNFFPTKIRKFFKTELNKSLWGATFPDDKAEIKYDDRLDSFFIFINQYVGIGIIFNNDSLCLEVFPISPNKTVLTAAYTALNCFLTTKYKAN